MASGSRASVASTNAPPIPTPAPLPLVKANGFTVVAEGVALDQHRALHLFSLLGRKAAVEAVAATLLTGQSALLYPDPARPGCEVWAPQVWAYRQLQRRLSDGTTHLVLLPARADFSRAQQSAFTLIAPPTAGALGAARLHYLFLAQCGETPLHDAWQDWLWTRAQRRGEAIPLDCHGALTAAWACQPDAASLRADLRLALCGATTYGPLPHPAASHEENVREVAA